MKNFNTPIHEHQLIYKNSNTYHQSMAVKANVKIIFDNVFLLLEIIIKEPNL